MVVSYEAPVVGYSGEDSGSSPDGASVSVSGVASSTVTSPDGASVSVSGSGVLPV
jgi:hypothetical protein